MTTEHASLTGDLEWLARVLWPCEGARLTSDDRPSPGFTRRRPYGVVPNASNPRLLVPLDARSARTAFLQFNDGMTQRARLRKAVAGALVTGPAKRLIRDRLAEDVRSDLDAQALAASSLEDHLAAILHHDEVRIAVTFGVLRPNRKPVLQVTEPDGAPLAYVKVGWNALTRATLENEAGALDRLAGRTRTFTVPRKLAFDHWNGLTLLVSEPVRHHLVRRGPLSAAPRPEIVREIVGPTTDLPLASAPIWTDLRARLHGEGDLFAQANDLAASFEERHGDVRFPVGAWHGDLGPWNLSRFRGHYAIWDWERYRDGVPSGLDLAHFAYQTSLATTGRQPRLAAGRALSGPPPTVAALGLTDRWPVLVTCYLFELFRRYDDAVRDGVVTPDETTRRDLLTTIGSIQR